MLSPSSAELSAPPSHLPGPHANVENYYHLLNHFELTKESETD